MSDSIDSNVVCSLCFKILKGEFMKKIKKHKWSIAILAMSIVILTVIMIQPARASSAADGIVIITHKDVAESAISKSDLKNIYLGKKSKLGGKKVTIITLKSGDTHKSFLKQYVSKTESQFKKYWKKQVFTGKGKTPKSFKKESDLVAHVAKTKGAIGYISSSSSNDSVKVLTIN